jgi:hypothetical protein
VRYGGADHYDCVEGVLKQSDTEAYLWGRKAANKGLAKAEYAVGCKLACLLWRIELTTWVRLYGNGYRDQAGHGQRKAMVHASCG